MTVETVTTAAREPELVDVPNADAAADRESIDEQDEYGHLTGTLAAYAEADPRSPRRLRLRDELVAGYLPVAHHIAARYANRGEPLEDLKQVASLGLVAALNRYQPDLCRSFLGFAIPTITGEVRRHFRDRTWSMRVPRRLKELNLEINKTVTAMAQELGRAPRPSEIASVLRRPLDEVLEALEASQAYRAESLDQAVGREEEAASLGDRLGEIDGRYELVTSCHSVAPHLAELPEREREILIMRFFEDMTQTQIAARFGISQMHVSRLLAKTLERLRTVLTADPEDSPGAAQVTASGKRTRGLPSWPSHADRRRQHVA